MPQLHSTRFAKSFFSAVAAAILAAPAALADERVLLGGRPFSPPSETLPMPADWTTAPIVHKTPEAVDVSISLDQQLYPAFGPLIEQYAKTHGLRVAVQEGTCGVSAGVLADKTVDIGGFCCPPATTDRLPGLTYHTVGIGALALIAHPDTMVDDVTLNEARALFGGDVLNWADLPMSGVKKGPDAPVRAIGRLHCKLRPGHWRLILDSEDRFSWALQEVSAITDMIRLVGATPGAIGYETLWHIQSQSAAMRGTKTKLLSIDGTSPRDAAALTRGAYPLYRVFNITTWSSGNARNPAAADLVRHLIARTKDVAREFSIVPAADLRAAGWRFDGDELVGEPAG